MTYWLFIDVNGTQVSVGGDEWVGDQVCQNTETVIIDS